MGQVVLYNSRFNLIFYHIPKCGMTTMLKAAPGGFHWVDYENISKDARVFTILRCPFERVISGYTMVRMLMQKDNREFEKRKIGALARRTIKKGNFSESINCFIEELHKGFFDGHVLPQKAYLDGRFAKDPDNVKHNRRPRKIEDVSAFLNLKRLNKGFSKLIKVRILLPRYNAGKNPNLTKIKKIFKSYRSVIKELYKEDYQLRRLVL